MLTLLSRGLSLSLTGSWGCWFLFAGRIQGIHSPFSRKETPSSQINPLTWRIKHLMLNFTTSQPSDKPFQLFTNFSTGSSLMDCSAPSGQVGGNISFKPPYWFCSLSLNKEPDLKTWILRTRFDSSGPKTGWSVLYLTESTSSSLFHGNWWPG